MLAWKKAQKLGRFDPDAPAKLEERAKAHELEARKRGLVVGGRVRVGGEGRSLSYTLLFTRL